MKVRIKVGAMVTQDHAVGHWPSCLPPAGWGDVDPCMAFEAEQTVRGYWHCKADGFGGGIPGAPPGRYGNGGITVLDADGVEALKAHNAELTGP